MREAVTGSGDRFAGYRVPRRVRGLGHNLLIAAAQRAGVGVRIWSRDPAVFVLSRGRRRVLIARLELGLNPAITQTVCRRKEAARVLLQRGGLPVPPGALLRLAEGRTAEIQAARCGFPLVLKPPDGSGGRLVYPNIRSRRELAARLAAYRRWGIREVLAERQIPGRNYRLLVLDRRLIGLAERWPAMVVGDGSSSVRQLVARSNAQRRGNLPVVPIVLDADARRVLRRQGLTPASVPRRGRRVQIQEVANIARGGRCAEVLSVAHRGWQAVGRRVLQAIPRSRFLGVDLVASDIRQSPSAQRWGVIEVNGSPDFELHHFPWEGEPSHPADALVAALFPR